MRVRLTSSRITLVTAPLDLRCGFPRLSAICQNLLGINLLLGRDIVIFISKNRQFVKIVGTDDKGSWLINRRLHQGRFQQLLSRASNSATEPLSVSELEHYLDGEDIQVKRRGLLKINYIIDIHQRFVTYFLKEIFVIFPLGNNELNYLLRGSKTSL